MTKVAVAILNWNGKLLLEKFLPTVLQHNPSDSEIAVIDNHSSDDSVSFLQKNFPGVKIISLKRNFGFARGYNEGLKNLNAEYYVLLNSDVQVTENWMQPIISLMDSDKNIAACQPKLLNYNVHDEFEYAGGAGGFIDKWAYPFCRGRIFNSFEKDKGQYDDQREIFWASGASLFIRSEIFHNTDGFDEDFIIHMEEIDLCWRIRNLGYKIMYCPHSVVYHVGAGTLAKMNPRKTFFNFRNNLLMFCKNDSSGFFLIKLFFRVWMDIIAAFKFLLSGDILHCIAVLRAHFSFYFMFLKMMRKRKAIRKKIIHYANSGIYHSSIVWEYFINGKRKFSELNKNLF